MPKDFLTAARTTRYPVDAFLFVQRGLDYTVRRIHGELKKADSEIDPASRHINGRELCLGLRDYAVDQYGLLAGAMLSRWRIQSCEDFGHIVFALVEAEILKKTEDDSIRDFIGVYDFATAFSGELMLTNVN